MNYSENSLVTSLPLAQVAFEVLQASNYLQMDSVQAETAEYLKNLVSKTNFLTVYDFAVSRGINSLSSYIMSTIIKPAEVVLILTDARRFFTFTIFFSGHAQEEVWRV